MEKAYIEWVNNIETEIRKRGVKLPKSTAAERESELGTGESRATASAKHVTAVLADAFDDNLGDFEDGHVTAQHLESPTRITRYEDETVLERSYIDLLDEATLKSLRPRLGIKSKHNLKKQQKKQLQAAGNDKLAAADDHIELGGIIPDRRQSMAVSPTADAIDHYTEKLQILTANLKQQRLLATNVSMSDKPLFGATAFITFKTQRSAMVIYFIKKNRKMILILFL